MSKKYKTLSPFGDWLIRIADEQGCTISGLARKAGLTPGTLRYLVIEPNRKPSLETCLRLSAITGHAVEELLALAGQTEHQAINPYHPDRIKIMSIFDHLPAEGRSALLRVATALADILEPQKGIEA